MTGSTALNVGSDRQLFVDDYLIESMSGAELRLHSPASSGSVLSLDMPWEGVTCDYHTVFQDDGVYRMYYRGSSHEGYTIDALLEPGEESVPVHHENVCYAESRDGITWTRPSLGLIEFEGSKGNNIVWLDEDGDTTDLVPFLDGNPEAAEDEKYKGIVWKGSRVFAVASDDAVTWRFMRDEPILTERPFDSQNVPWDPSRVRHIHARKIGTGGSFGGGYRWIRRRYLAGLPGRGRPWSSRVRHTGALLIETEGGLDPAPSDTPAIADTAVTTNGTTDFLLVEGAPGRHRYRPFRTSTSLLSPDAETTLAGFAEGGLDERAAPPSLAARGAPFTWPTPAASLSRRGSRTGTAGGPDRHTQAGNRQHWTSPHWDRRSNGLAIVETGSEGESAPGTGRPATPPGLIQRSTSRRVTWRRRFRCYVSAPAGYGPMEISVHFVAAGFDGWRKDGFVSASVGYGGGEVTTRPLEFDGGELELAGGLPTSINYSTSAVGSIRIEMQDENGDTLAGFGLGDYPEMFGDEIDGVAR